MEFKEIISVTGKSGLYKIESPRQDGIIATELGATKRTFLSTRKHSFTPLDNIGIYQVSGDTIALGEVFNKIVEQGGNRPTVQSSADDIRAFFDLVIPSYDEDKFKMSDMKKVLQWYDALEENDAFEEALSSNSEEE